MAFAIIEIQNNPDGTLGVLQFVEYEKKKAEKKYHDCLSAAAESVLPIHTVTMLDNKGNIVKREMYKHNAEGEVE